MTCMVDCRRSLGTAVYGGMIAATVLAAQFDGGRSAISQPSVHAFDTLEQRVVLAANDILVSLANNRVVLALDAAGTTIDDLSTNYAANAVTMTAETTNTISTTTPITGITIVDDTITVDLTLIPRLSGIMVRGGE